MADNYYYTSIYSNATYYNTSTIYSGSGAGGVQTVRLAHPEINFAPKKKNNLLINFLKEENVGE